ncbi:hypothetical protein CVT26_014558 [Gymnopilus dilepis]|uniref:Uncharacterized protein n=1 Tax=Gymnopilus dilepis TaxID=231916 RepID=A0A409VVJ6_9AGAR|nr:hypothetical protein CVT26_014558 [Gymnopilus dilepis]
MAHVTVWFTNEHKGAQPVVVKWRNGSNLTSLNIGKGHTEIRTFPMNSAKQFSVHRLNDNAMARKWEPLSDDTVLNIGSLTFAQ